MHKLFLGLAVSSSLLVCGCAEHVEKAKKADQPSGLGVEVHAPGVDVTLDKEHGLHVEAGETEVNANKEEGVNVKAPGAEVEVQRQKAGDE